MDRLKEYKKGRACEKCGERGAKTLHKEGLSQDYIIRTCRNCDYRWTERPISNVEDES